MKLVTIVVPEHFAENDLHDLLTYVYKHTNSKEELGAVLIDGKDLNVNIKALSSLKRAVKVSEFVQILVDIAAILPGPLTDDVNITKSLMQHVLNDTITVSIIKRLAIGPVVPEDQTFVNNNRWSIKIIDFARMYLQFL